MPFVEVDTAMMPSCDWTIYIQGLDDDKWVSMCRFKARTNFGGNPIRKVLLRAKHRGINGAYGSEHKTADIWDEECPELNKDLFSWEAELNELNEKYNLDGTPKKTESKGTKQQEGHEQPPQKKTRYDQLEPQLVMSKRKDFEEAIAEKKERFRSGMIGSKHPQSNYFIMSLPEYEEFLEGFDQQVLVSDTSLNTPSAMFGYFLSPCLQWSEVLKTALPSKKDCDMCLNQIREDETTWLSTHKEAIDETTAAFKQLQEEKMLQHTSNQEMLTTVSKLVGCSQDVSKHILELLGPNPLKDMRIAICDADERLTEGIRSGRVWEENAACVVM